MSPKDWIKNRPELEFEDVKKPKLFYLDGDYFYDRYLDSDTGIVYLPVHYDGQKYRMVHNPKDMRHIPRLDRKNDG